MTNLFTLDDLRAAADRKFAPLKIELSDGSVVVLRNLLRMSDKERATALAALDVLTSADGAGGDSDEKIGLTKAAMQAIEAVADRGSRLVQEIDGDLTLALEILEEWVQVTEPGEAPNSLS